MGEALCRIYWIFQLENSHICMHFHVGLNKKLHLRELYLKMWDAFYAENISISFPYTIF